MARNTLELGSVVRYAGDNPSYKGMEGIVDDINVAKRQAHVDWAKHEHRSGLPPTWEDAKNLKPIRAFTKHFRRGSLASAMAKLKTRPVTNPRPGARPPSPPRRPPGRPGRVPAPPGPASVLSSVRRMAGAEKPFDPEQRYPRETKPHHFAVNRRALRPNQGDDLRDEIAEGAARAFFVDRWTNEAEELGHSFGGGTDVMDVAPETPPEVLPYAEQFLDVVQQLNGRTVTQLYEEHDEAASGPTASPDVFGHYLAMQAMGHGVSWYDDYPVPPSGEVRVPHAELWLYVDPDDIENVTVENFEIDTRFA